MISRQNASFQWLRAKSARDARETTSRRGNAHETPLPLKMMLHDAPRIITNIIELITGEKEKYLHDTFIGRLLLEPEGSLNVI
ncbi:unnamed protein product [Trichogramma brassicae]|uniref:Uncharacterized protein n=1 Tax=Trichogramma brassicae TaxID=86971 RepID=A0A6H5IZM8_9HYME|nr:unnamed protein product [Trichogramma brassicae]